MSISERMYIRWFPDEASEPTSTIVLTAHNRQFVDLRLTLAKSSDSTQSVPSSLGPFTSLEWGIGGRSVGTPSHGIWVHDIDSLIESPGPDEKDEGDMFPHPELPDVTLERGEMRHPESREVRAYEEAWREVPILPDPAPGLTATPAPVPVGGSGTSGGLHTSVVLETSPLGLTVGGSGQGKGLIVRLGQFCQGIVRVGSKLAVERWVWSEDGWMRVARLGDAEIQMPCEATWREGISEGETVELSGSEDSVQALVWVVKELRKW